MEWMHKNFLKLNNTKTEFMVIGSKHNLKYLENVNEIRVGNSTVGCSKSGKNIGAIFDSQLNMVDHVSAMCHSCYLHIRNIGTIRPYCHVDV